MSNILLISILILGLGIAIVILVVSEKPEVEPTIAIEEIELTRLAYVDSLIQGLKNHQILRKHYKSTIQCYEQWFIDKGIERPFCPGQI